MATQTETRCAHCDVPILDPTTQVVHSDARYCCSNCANAMEQSGSGSDPNIMNDARDFHCAHCGTPIKDESTMEERGDQAFCCSNCARA